MNKYKIEHPIDNFKWDKNISQLFGVDRTYYSKLGVVGHPGIDYVTGWNAVTDRNGHGFPVKAAHGGRVSKVLPGHAYDTRGKGVHITGNGFETVYWHLKDTNVKLNEPVEVGQVIGWVGNTGKVIPKPTKAEPYNGTHLHFGLKIHSQSYWRGWACPLFHLKAYESDTAITSKPKYPMSFRRNLSIGMYGDDVAWLQSILQIEGCAEFQPTNYFGKMTLEAVKKFQEKNLIKPVSGFVGELTREKLDKYCI